MMLTFTLRLNFERTLVKDGKDSYYYEKNENFGVTKPVRN